MNTINLTQSYTFSKFFELKIAASDLAKAFGYSFERTFQILTRILIHTLTN